MNIVAAPSQFVEPLRSGSAILNVEMVAGQSTATCVLARSPLKILTPKARGASVWAFTSGLGGGYVAGDQTDLRVDVDSGARCFMGTQASTKIYRNPSGRPCRHRLRATVGSGAMLVMAPDPIQSFAESIYEQQQEIRLDPMANLALVDWVGSGRIAREERWSFSRYQSRIDVFCGDQRVFVDSVRLDPRDGPLAGTARMGRFNCIALVLVIGEKFKAAAMKILAEFNELAVTRSADIVCAASPVWNGTLLRLAGCSVEQVGDEIARHLRFVGGFLGDDPWARKW